MPNLLHTVERLAGFAVTVRPCGLPEAISSAVATSAELKATLDTSYRDHPVRHSGGLGGGRFGPSPAASPRRGDENVDGAALAEFMAQRIADRQPSVIVFALDVVPAAVTEPSGEAIFWKYLDAGGKIVWLGLSPLAVKVDAETGKTVAIDLARSGKLFGVNHAEIPFAEVGSTATPDGTRWGLEPWWIGSQSVAVGEVTTVRGRAEHGRASAWVKSYGGPQGTGFVRLWGRPQAPADLASVKAVAEYGLR